MKRKFRIIPWWMTKESRSLSGREKDIAKLEYLYHPSLDRDLEINKIRYTEDSMEFKKQVLWIKNHYGELTDIEYQKDLYTLEGKPFIELIEGKYTKDDYGSGRLAFEFEWNQLFILELKKNGYAGMSPDEIVNNWFVDICYQIADTEYRNGYEN